MGSCRLCLGPAEMNLFFEDRKIAVNTFVSHSKIKIYRNDGLTQFICLICIQKLEEFYEFLSKCEESDRILRSKHFCETKSIDILSELKAFNIDDDNLVDDYIVAPKVIPMEHENDDNDVVDNHFVDDDDVLEPPSLGDADDKKSDDDILDLNLFDLSGHLCNICGESFAFGQQSQFNHHLLTHGEREFKCDECPRAYFTLKSLKTHKNTHKAVKKFPCEYCNKMFTAKGRVKDHMEYVHKRTNSYKCEYCERVFYRPDYFKKHLSIVHGKEQSFVCRSCNLSFPFLKDLRIHNRIHTGEDAFSCRYCEKKFTLADDLHIHEKIHSRRQPFMCEVCSKTFAQKKFLIVHIKNHHSQSDEQENEKWKNNKNDSNMPESPLAENQIFLDEEFSQLWEEDFWNENTEKTANINTAESNFVTNSGKKRRRPRHDDEWIDVKRKRLKNLGKEYRSRRGEIVPEKKLGDPCKTACKLKCTDKFSEQERQTIFNKFWGFGDRNKQWLFIIEHTTKQGVRRRTTGKASKRIYTFKYFLPAVTNVSETNGNIEVCKTIFLNTISTSDTTVSTAWKKYDGFNFECDLRGKHKNHKTNKEMIQSVCDHVNSFEPIEYNSLLQRSDKLYLKGCVSVAQMFNSYCKWYKPEIYLNKAHNIRQYRDILNKHFDLGFL